MRVLIEGWRGISHSYAMVNCYQILELLERDGLELYHRDLPFPNAKWNNITNNPGLPAPLQTLIESLPPPDQSRYDCAYSISWPYKTPTPEAAKVLTFMTAEYGLKEIDFVGQTPNISALCAGENRIITPSSWSKMKLIEFGFPEEKVTVISHGVNSTLYFPAGADERQSLRQQINATPEHFVFLNLGAMSRNKGIDVLIPAFIEIRRRYPQARLVMKDDKGLYGMGAADAIHQTLTAKGLTLTDEIRSSITLISATLTLPQMRLLYGSVDAYVSPYRAEGFNLPVVEAIACGTPVIVSDGGATDDFCDPQTARFIRTTRIDNAKCDIPRIGYHLEPDYDSLVQQMEGALTASPANYEVFEKGRHRLIEKLSWAACAQKLAECF
ncbi:Group 1 glycosyl transferase [Gammaproteobacteria bacterium]